MAHRDSYDWGIPHASFGWYADKRPTHALNAAFDDVTTPDACLTKNPRHLSSAN